MSFFYIIQVAALLLLTALGSEIPQTPYLYRYVNNLDWYIAHFHTSFEGHPQFDRFKSELTLYNTQKVVNALLETSKNNGISVPMFLPLEYYARLNSTNTTGRKLSFNWDFEQDDIQPTPPTNTENTGGFLQEDDSIDDFFNPIPKTQPVVVNTTNTTIVSNTTNTTNNANSTANVTVPLNVTVPNNTSTNVTVPTNQTVNGTNSTQTPNNTSTNVTVPTNQTVNTTNNTQTPIKPVNLNVYFPPETEPEVVFGDEKDYDIKTMSILLLTYRTEDKVVNYNKKISRDLIRKAQNLSLVIHASPFDTQRTSDVLKTLSEKEYADWVVSFILAVEP